MSRTQPTRYSFAANGSTSQINNYGNLLVKDGVARVDKLAYGVGFGKNPMAADGVTVFRILPHREVDEQGVKTNVWTPFRNSLEERDYGDWIRTYRAVRGIGPYDNRTTFIVSDPIRDGFGFDKKYPSDVLFNNISQVTKTGNCPGTWSVLINGDQKHHKALKRSEFIYMAKAVVLYKNGDHFKVPKGLQDTLLLEITGSAGRALLAEIDRPISETTKQARMQAAAASGVAPNPFALQFEHGDPVALDAGVFFMTYRAGDGDPATRAQRQQAAQGFAPPSASTLMAPAGQQQGSVNADAAYTVKVLSHYNGAPPSLFSTPDYYPFIAKVESTFEKLLFFPTAEEQVDLLAKRFDIELFNYAFANHPEWLKQVRAIKGMVASVQGFTAEQPAAGGAPAGQQFAPPAVQQYGAPAAPQYGAPAPQYGAPAAPQFGAQVPQQFGAPMAPAAPQYGVPAATQFGQQTGYAAPGFATIPANPMVGAVPPAAVDVLATPVNAIPVTGQQPNPQVLQHTNMAAAAQYAVGPYASQPADGFIAAPGMAAPQPTGQRPVSAFAAGFAAIVESDSQDVPF